MSDIDWPAVLLAFLNTTPVMDGITHDLLAVDADAHAWLTAHGGAGEQDLATVRRLRDDLQAVVRGQKEATTLVSYLGGCVQTPRLDATGLHWELRHAPDWPTRITLTWGEVQHDTPDRLRPCGNPDCRLFLLDRTRAGTARWCSMSVCGNRMKARRHYTRTVRRDSP